MSRTPREYAEWLGEQLAENPEAVEAVCDLAEAQAGLVLSGKAELNVQWKGTDLCADFQCVCSPAEEMFEFHVDAITFGVITCPRCRREWKLSQVTLEEVK